MKRLKYFALFVLLFSLACGSMPVSSPTPTPSPEPTSTFTPRPTETPSPVPTATQDIFATMEAQKTQTANGVLDELNKILGDTDIPYKNGTLMWEENKPVTAGLNGPDRQYIGIDDKLLAGNFILKSDVRWKASGIIFCGAVFRSESNFEQGKQHQFIMMRFSGLPAWSIELHEFGRFKNSQTSVKYSGAINQENDSINQFLIIAQDEQFTVYLNGVRQGNFFDNSKQRTEGHIAFLGFQDSGKGSCKFENSWVWELK